jgi:hypothetical protein
VNSRRAVRSSGNNIGKGAASVNPKLPCRTGVMICHSANLQKTYAMASKHQKMVLQVVIFL